MRFRPHFHPIRISAILRVGTVFGLKNNPDHFRFFDGLWHNSDLFHAGNLRQLEDFQFQKRPITEPVSQSDQLSDPVVETFRKGIGQTPSAFYANAVGIQ